MENETRHNRRFAGVAVVAFVAFFGVDWYLFAHQGFLHRYGQATQEGQVLSKVARATVMADVADVIFFGSSYVRSGVSGEPFLAHGILPFNFAVSGGGPLYHYFALRRIASTLQQRADKPLLVLELKTDPLVRTRGSAWSEYPQFSAIVRSRAEMVQHALPLWRNFRDFGMTSQLISGMMIPSSIYRSHTVPMLGAHASLDSFFYGIEDFSGYSPLLTRATPRPGLPTVDLPPAPLASLYAGKIDFLKSFLELARSLGCPVILYESPSVLLGRDHQVLEPLVTELQAAFPNLQVVRSADYQLTIDDFDEGGHLNIRGSDAMSEYLAKRIGVSGSAAALDAKIDRAFLQAPIPDVASWTMADGRVSGGGAELTIAAAPSDSPLVAQSPPIPVSAGHEWALEVAMPSVSGRLSVVLSWQTAAGEERALEFLSPVEAPFFGASNRMFLRATPGSGVVTIKVFDYELQNLRPASAGQIKFLRLWANR